MIEGEEALEGRRIQPGETLRFECGPTLSCFNSCCRNKRLQLFPYDLLRLRVALGLPSSEVLERFVVMEIDPGSGWPIFRLGLKSDGACPFVSDRGCAVYEHRPTCCRIFPLTRAVAAGPDGQTCAEIFLASRTEGCLGWDQPRSLTLEEWVKGQGLGDYHHANNRAAQFFLHPRRARPMELAPRQIHLVVMALFNLDVFRDAVEDAGFARHFGFTRREIDLALTSDEALLDLGLCWATAQVFAADACG